MVSAAGWNFIICIDHNIGYANNHVVRRRGRVAPHDRILDADGTQVHGPGRLTGRRVETADIWFVRGADRKVVVTVVGGRDDDRRGKPRIDVDGDRTPQRLSTDRTVSEAL